MAWYRNGTVAVTNGSATVTGTGTDFVGNTSIGEVFLGPDGRVYEIATVVSATQLTIVPAYQGGTAGAQAYGIQPTSSFARDLALGVSQLLNTFGAVRDGIGQGMFPDGNDAAPGVRFAADQDTGILRVGSNVLGLVAGGQRRFTIDENGAFVSGRRLGIGGTTSSLLTHATNSANWSTGIMDGTNRWAVTENQFGSEMLTVLSNGNVGVATTAPRGKLEVYRTDASVANFTLSSSFAPASYVELNAGINGVSNGGFDMRMGGVSRLCITENGDVGIGAANGNAALVVFRPRPESLVLQNSASLGTKLTFYDINFGAEIEHNSGSLRFKYNNTQEGFRLENGNLLIGTQAGTSHIITKPNLTAEGQNVLQVASNVGETVLFFGVAAGGASSAATAARFGRSSTTGRSINAAGTINASGADYAEYMTKADGCGAIAKGDVVGVDADGKLTKSWAAAKSFVVKSTDPAYVGGDSWAAHLPPKPVDPGAAPMAPTAPIAPAPLPAAPVAPEREEGEGDDTFTPRLADFFAACLSYEALAAEHAAHDEAAAAFTASLAEHEAALAAWEASKAAYDADLPAWEADLEKARRCVDRIAFAGQVPVNIAGTFAVGDYLIAAARGGGIEAVAVAEADITFDQYRRRLGKVWAIREGRPWIDVQHG